MIRIDNMCFGYGSRMIFRDYSLTIEEGQSWAVIGPSGCGKTSLLLLLAGLVFPVSGSISVAQEALLRPRPLTGLVLQDHGLLPWATVRDNVRLGFRIRRLYGADGRHAPAHGHIESGQAAEKKVDYWLKRLRISEYRDRYPLMLSGGQRQRTAIARTMVLEPDLLLLDEPFSALDAPTREELQQVLIDLHRESGRTQVIVTHDIEVAVAMGRNILAIEKGCNRRATIIANDCAGDLGLRYGRRFGRKCRELKTVLEAMAW